MLPIITEPDRFCESIVYTLQNGGDQGLLSLILIDGYHGAGKTTLSSLLGSHFAKIGKHYLLLSTDHFMRFSRTQRMLDAKRYFDHPNWYDIDKLTNTVTDILERKTAHLRSLYNHQTGELDTDLDISPIDVNYVILEGMYACHPKLLALSSFSLFLLANHEALLRRVLARDSVERNIPEDIIRSRYWIINGPLFQNHLETIHKKLSLVIDTSQFPKRILITEASKDGAVACSYLLPGDSEFGLS